MAGLTKLTKARYDTLDDFSRLILDRLAKDAPNMRDITPDSSGNYADGIKRMAAKGVNFIRVPSGQFIVGDCKLTKSMMFLGDGIEGIDPVAATFIKPSTASYCISFDSTGYTRPQGGGIRHVNIRGANSSDTGDLIIAKSWSYLRFEYCGFHNLKGTALNLRDIAESKINDNLFRRIGNSDGQVILMGDYVTSQLNNVNNLHIKDNTFGLCSGAWLRSTTQSNVDLIWFSENKVEWDNTPAGANLLGEYVIDLAQVSRAWITNNGFTHFREDEVHNRYIGILRMGPQSLMSVTFSGNKLFGCKGYIFYVEGGSLEAYNNYSNQADASGSVTWYNSSTRRCYIEPPVLVQNNGNVVSTAIQGSSNFYPSSILGGTINNTFVRDDESSYQVVMQVPAGSEVRRVTLPEDLTTGNDAVRVTARVKSVGGAGSLRLNTNGTIDIATNSISTADAWVNTVFTIPSGQLGAGGVRLFNAGTTTLLFDGVKIERADYLDVGFDWSPGTIAAGVKVVSPTQGFVSQFIDPSTAIKGFSIPSFNGVTGDVEVGIRPTTAPSNWVVTLSNRTAADITPSFTRCRVRLFL